LILYSRGNHHFASGLQFDVIEHHFGVVYDDMPSSYRFLYKNRSGSQIKIKATASCGCTLLDLPQTSVAPDAEGFIIVSVNSRGRRGPSESSVLVTAEGLEKTQTLLHVDFVGKSRIEIVPSAISISNLGQGSEESIKVLIHSVEPDMAIANASISMPFSLASADFVKTPTSDGVNYHVRLAIVISSKEATREPRGIIVLMLHSSGGDRFARIPVSVTTVSDFKISPTVTFIAEHRAHDAFVYDVDIASSSSLPYTVHQVSLENPENLDLTCKLTPASGSGAWKVHVAGNTPDHSGAFRFGVVLEKQLGDTPTSGTILPFLGFVNQAQATQQNDALVK
jgi:hypothetical protein